MRRLICAVLLVAAGSMAMAPARADDTIKPFVGTFAGTADVEIKEGVTQKRNVRIIVKQTDRGFVVDWTTEFDKDGKTVKNRVAVEFAAVRNDKVKFHPSVKVFAAGMRRNLFGKRIPIDPLTGDPYYWASISKGTMRVYGVRVVEDGGWEVQIYERKIVPGGMHLTFKRIRNGTPLKDINATLKRVK